MERQSSVTECGSPEVATDHLFACKSSDSIPTSTNTSSSGLSTSDPSDAEEDDTSTSTHSLDNPDLLEQSGGSGGYPSQAAAVVSPHRYRMPGSFYDDSSSLSCLSEAAGQAPSTPSEHSFDNLSSVSVVDNFSNNIFARAKSWARGRPR